MTPLHKCNLRTIAEHTVDLSLLTRESKVLDLGCRNFGWSKAMLEYVDKVYCVDADPDVSSDDPRLKLFHGAVLPYFFKPVELRRSGNGTGNRVYESHEKTPNGNYVSVTSVTIDHLLRYSTNERSVINKCLAEGTDPDPVFFDVIKFDIEGSEISVLLALKEPPAKQLTCEFHMHTGTPKETVHSVFNHLQSLGYEKVFEDYSRKHGLCENYWDTLFILKSELNGI